MKQEYRFELVKGKPKETCPSCRKARRYVRYIDVLTKQLLPNKYGRCDREQSCTYHLNPYSDEYLKDETIDFDIQLIAKSQPIEKPPSYVSYDIMKSTIGRYDSNYFTIWLHSFLTNKDIIQACQSYNIGTSKHWSGSTVFWQVDQKGKVRSGKVMLFDPSNGKRIKKPFSYINWVHKVLKQNNFNLKQCYFGEHLISNNDQRNIAIVESEKTAIIASIYLSDYIWLASGSLNGINTEKSKILKGRTCYLFPDLGAAAKWEEKASILNELLPTTKFIVSYLLEEVAKEYNLDQGCDLADFLPKINRHTTTFPPTNEVIQKKSFSTFGEVFDFIKENCPRLSKSLELTEQ